MVPCDTITLDIDYIDGCRYFTWDHQLFPYSFGLIKTLVDDKWEVVIIADPHIKIDEEYQV